MYPDLEDKVVIVTGAGGGIGRETVKRFVRNGALVIAADLDETAGQETVASTGEEKRVTYVRADVSDPESMARLVERTVELHGRLDVAHNNAGIELNGPLLADVTPEQFNRVIAVNLSGVFLAMRAQIPAMAQGSGGSIINTSSGLGVVAFAGQSAYVASKHGVIGLTKTAALEYSSRGIRVNALLPGVVRTPMVEAIERDVPGFLEMATAKHPIGRLAVPADIANAVLWLASEASSFVTGASIAVDGGFLAQ
ncbi:SDR family NAD(P)-dependent oxidoreductase [Amycolatopsis sp. EV170708-02-1]|uniref:SDR family NAD(P)-dependent oxidoreductase n=1 Tax=Amycolatopsis sp. EV170708-02-1 TaxID=2919322 RepID=UPI001F0C9D52|nr:glucose 1-dehydrogenase [Amycolatopsis sp. EV170708-02-1]UMP03416.1 glucose 1-dehydrogenase [Amycolatopsis sp. EV170708-02-1]